MSSEPLNELARQAADGDRDAVTDLVHQIRDPVYRMALRFLGHPHDAEDATQEILIRVITHPQDSAGQPREPALAPGDGQRLQRAAGELDAALQIAELYRMAPAFTAPERVWQEVRAAMPDLLGEGSLDAG